MIDIMRRRPSLWGALAVFGVLGWWWWPSLVDRGPTNDVLIIGDGDLTESSEPVVRRIRERGLSVVENSSFGSWCEAADALPRLLDDVRPATVIVSFRTDGGCGDSVSRSVDAIADRRAVLVVQPGVGRQDESLYNAIYGLVADNIAIADPTRLLGDELATNVTCQWWDDCLPDGSVEVRDTTGTLTSAGAERIARVIVSHL
jgi:hypothetical protein